VRKLWREHSLLIVSLFVFLVLWLGGQAVAGNRTYNEEQVEHGESPVSFGTYLTTAHFGEATFENWESEFLQMGAYVLLTIRLRQKGSAESKDFGPQEVDEDPVKHSGDRAAPGDCDRVRHLASSAHDIADETLGPSRAHEPADLWPGEHLGELSHEPRTQQVLEATLDPGGNDSAGDSTGRDRGRHEHASVQHDEHYEAFRLSSRTARSSS